METPAMAANGKTSAAKKSSSKTAEALAQARADRLKLLGHIIRLSRGDLTQAQLAELVSKVRGNETLQTSISRWEAGMVALDVEMIRDIEIALQVEPGSILVAAGYVSPETRDVTAMLRADPELRPEQREDVVRHYKAQVALARQLNDAERTRVRRRQNPGA